MEKDQKGDKWVFNLKKIVIYIYYKVFDISEWSFIVNNINICTCVKLVPKFPAKDII